MFKAVMKDQKYTPADYPQTEKYTLYVSEEDNLCWMICPCDLDDNIKTKCPGRIIRLPLDGDWKISVEEDIPTISPSVSSVSFPCKSHFFLTEGKLRFLPPTPDSFNPWKDGKGTTQLVRG